MNLYTFLFYFFEASAALAAVVLIFSRNLFYGALLLLVSLLSVAALYVLAWAEFVAITQILIYAGGVLVLILFGIMLTARLGKKPMLVQHVNVFSGTLAGIGFTALLTYAFIHHFNFATNGEARLPGMNTVETIGGSLMTTYLLPFEIAGVLLLVALIGAAVIASHKSETDAPR